MRSPRSTAYWGWHCPERKRAAALHIARRHSGSHAVQIGLKRGGESALEDAKIRESTGGPSQGLRLQGLQLLAAGQAFLFEIFMPAGSAAKPFYIVDRTVAIPACPLRLQCGRTLHQCLCSRSSRNSLFVLCVSAMRSTHCCSPAHPMMMNKAKTFCKITDQKSSGYDKYQAIGRQPKHLIDALHTYPHRMKRKICGASMRIARLKNASGKTHHELIPQAFNNATRKQARQEAHAAEGGQSRLFASRDLVRRS